MISKDLVKKLGLKTYIHPNPYPLGWMSNKINMWFIHKCKLRFSISVDYIDKVGLDVVPLDVARILLGNPYLFDKDVIYYRRENKYQLVNDGNTFILKSHPRKNKTPIVEMGNKVVINASRKLTLITMNT